MNEPEVHLPPEDVVPQTGVTATVVRQLDAELAATRQLTITFPGDVLCDPLGVPIGVEPATTVTATGNVRISRTELNQTGLTQEEIPNVRIS